MFAGMGEYQEVPPLPRNNDMRKHPQPPDPRVTWEPLLRIRVPKNTTNNHDNNDSIYLYMY